MLGQKGFAWPLYPSIVLCVPVTGSWAVLELCHFRPANTPSPITDSHSSPSLLEMPAPEGSPSGPSPHLQSPMSIQRMPPPRVVRSCSMPPPICLLYFPRLSRGSQCPISMLLGAGGQAAVSMAADHCQVDSKRHARRLVFVPPPSVSGRSRGQKWISSSL